MIQQVQKPSGPANPGALTNAALSTGQEPQAVGRAPSFRLMPHRRRNPEQFWRMDTYSAAMAFVRGEFDVEGDLIAAIAARCAAPRNWRDGVYAALARLSPARLESWFQTRARAAENIRYHYDCSNEFYEQFLDSRLVYSCAYFRQPEWSIDEAQLAKLDHICRKLDLQPGEKFLDVGCGWGALVIHAAEQYGASATGCTLSRKQFTYAMERAQQSRAATQITLLEADYRDVAGRYDKIASVGMFEHVGRRRLGQYFQKIAELLSPGGLFMNHGIIRPQHATDSAETLFVRKRVFPGGELPYLSDVIRTAEAAGFEVLDVENWRPHYALTCRAWVQRLQQNQAACLRFVDPERYRTWLLYLAASAYSFERGHTDVYQILLTKRSSGLRKRLTRDYMYK